MTIKKFSRKTTIIAILLVLGTGTWLSTFMFADTVNVLKQQLLKLQLVISYTNSFYVDDVDWDNAMTGAIQGMLESLDPHSVYIDAKSAKSNEESFSGKYEGIGIQFDVIDRLITVVGVFMGAPAQKVGLESGDKIVKINGVTAVGMSREDVPKKLKGDAGTIVQVSVRRENVDDLLEFDIERAAIPLYSVYASYMWDKETGYISLTRFMATTGREIEEAMDKLEAEGMERLILDLRGNPGGYLNEAVKVAGKFIPGHKQIVFTRNRSGEIVSELYSDTFSKEKTRKMPLIVMIDHASASASEIVSGALQDYDRALIVGENSFGKGLVQKEFDLRDGSKLRLTTQKYYIPSGRLIQKDYKGKNRMEYYSEEAAADSVAADSTDRPIYYTLRQKRKVFGGGGIYPDELITEGRVYSKEPNLTAKLMSKRVFFETARRMINAGEVPYKDHREFVEKFHFTNADMDKIIAVSKEKELDFSREKYDNAEEYIHIKLMLEIARSKYGIDQMYEVLSRLDKEVGLASNYFSDANKMIKDFPFK